jgi:hypothetical protein
MKFIEISRDIILWNNPFNHFFHKGRGSKRIVIDEETLTSYFKVKVVGKSLIDIEQTLFPALTKMFGGYGNIVKSDRLIIFKTKL